MSDAGYDTCSSSWSSTSELNVHDDLKETNNIATHCAENASETVNKENGNVSRDIDIEACRPEQNKQTTSQLTASYIDSFSMHGLSYIFKGHPLERFMWLLCFVTAAIIAGILCYCNYQMLMKNEVRTEIRVKEMDAVPLPKITFCFDWLLLEKLMCYKNKTIHPIFKCNTNQKELSSFKCSYYDRPCQLRRENSACVTFNSDGKLKQIGEGSAVTLQFNASMHSEKTFFPPNIIAYISNETYLSEGALIQETFHRFIKPGEYKMYLESIENSRQQHPYPTNCSTGTDIPNSFSTKYTRQGCIETCLMNRMARKCGDVIDWWKPYLKHTPSIPARMVTRNTNDTQLRVCIEKELRSSVFFPDKNCQCPLPCREISFNHINVQTSSNAEKYWEIKLQYKAKQITYISEEPLYSCIQFLSDLGGSVGLMLGMSVLSAVELVAAMLIVTSSTVKLIVARCLNYRPKK